MIKQNVYDSPCLFPDMDLDSSLSTAKQKQRNRWELKKNRNLWIEFCSTATFCGKYGIPLIRKYTDDWPQNFITVSELGTIGGPSIGVAGFDYDYILERFTSNPELYIPVLSRYKCICEPDFSIKIGDPLAIAVANSFRSHTFSYYLQERGFKVMSTIKWAMSNSFDVCFSGYEKGGSVIVSTIGVMRDERSRYYFERGFTEMLKRISPDSVGLYGSTNEWIEALMPSQLDVRHFSHNRFNRMRGYGR